MVAGLGALPAPTFFRLMSTEETYDRQLALYQSKPTVERALDRFTEKVYEVETVDELIEDFETRQFLTQAFGIEGDLANSVGFLKRILTDDLGAEDALVYRMNDQRFLKMASDLRLDQGLETIRDPVSLAFIRAQYETVGLEQEVGQENLGVREAMYFRRSVGEIDNAFQILADNVLRTVVFGTLQIPDEVAFQDIDKQAAIIEARLDLEDLKDEEFVDNFLNRYLLQQEPTGTDATAGVASLIQPLFFDDTGVAAPVIYSLDVNLLI